MELAKSKYIYILNRESKNDFTFVICNLRNGQGTAL